MDGKPLRISLGDLPNDLDSLPDDTEIVWDDHDELMDDEFWNNLEATGQ